MTVAIDTTPLAGEPTGIGRYVMHLVEALGALPEPPKLLRYVVSRRATGLDPDVVRLHYPATVAVRLWGHVGLASGHGRLSGADVVHGTNYVAPPTGRPTVLTVHDCTFVTHPQWCRPVVRAFAPVVRRAISRGAWIHTPSQYVADQVGELFGTDRVVVVHHGPPDPLPDPATLPKVIGLHDRPFVLALGGIEHRKNLVGLIEAFGLFHRDHPEMQLVIAGPDGPARPDVDAAIGRLAPAASSSVVLTGWLDEPHRIAALTHASVLAYPSIEEGFGLPILEGMAAGVPVVGGNAGSIPEVAGDAALLVDPNDPGALAEALARAIDDDDLRTHLAAAGRLRLGEYSWERCAAGLMELYGRTGWEG
ncbi:MAG: glycosyltransferase family 4 protein [Acidimicrobiia bacterium]